MSVALVTLLSSDPCSLNDADLTVDANCKADTSGSDEAANDLSLCLPQTLTEGRQQQSDSELFNSSRNTVSSMSDDTEMTDDYDESRGVIDYFPQQLTSLTEVHAMENIHVHLRNTDIYDEAEEVVDSDVDSSDLLEVVVDKTTDSTIHGAIEMSTFRMETTACVANDDSDGMVGNLYLAQHNRAMVQSNTMRYDEAVLVDDDVDHLRDNNIDVIPHRQMLGCKVGQKFSSMKREDSEDYEMDAPLSSSSSIAFPTASDGVRIEREVRQRGRGAGGKVPPFGDPVDVEKVSKSAERLIDFHPPCHQDVHNLPPAERISRHTDAEGNNSEVTTKKKKKKKKSVKDDVEESNRNQKSGTMDINGNPMTERNTIHRGSAALSTTKVSNCTSLFPRNKDHLGRLEMNGQQVSDMDDHGNKSDLQKKSRATRRREQEQLQMRRAEEIEDYRGNTKQIEELVVFIESGKTGGKKQKKKLGLSTSGMVNGNGNDSGNGSIPNGHIATETLVGFTTKNGKKAKQNIKGKASVQKDYKKSCSGISSPEKADDSGSCGGKSEADEGRDLDGTVPNSSGSSTTVSEKSSVDADEPSAIAEMLPDCSATAEMLPDSSATTELLLDSSATAEMLPDSSATAEMLPDDSKFGDVEDDTKSLTASTSSQSFQSSIKDMVDDFIFTDFENVQVLSEGEFNVVTRKKRQRSQIEQPIFRGNYNPRENYHYDVRYNSLLAPREERLAFREEGRPITQIPQRSRPMLRSVTPPPISTSVENDRYYYQEKVTGDRAFSPSAFPALGGMREGRRNSTGDVPSAIDPDDSDMESVKSLPLGACHAAGNRIEATIAPLISYAKIAAGPRASCCKSVTSAAVWGTKGEPESEIESNIDRRHSSSSFADPLVEDPYSETVCTNQKSFTDAQKDDCLTLLEPNSDSSQTTQPQVMSVVTPAVNVSSKSNDQTVDSVVAASLEASSNNEQLVGLSRTRQKSNRSDSDIADNNVVVAPIVSSVKMQQTNDPVMSTPLSLQLYEPASCVSGLTFGSSSNSDLVPLMDQTEFPAISDAAIIHQSPKSGLSFPPVPKASPLTVSSRNQSVVNHSSVKCVEQQEKIVSVSAVNANSTTANKKQKNKSVVFLDRRSTPDLGISFRFDTNLTVVGGDSSNSVAMNTTGDSAILAISTKALPGTATVPDVPKAASTISDVKQAVCACNGLVPAKVPISMLTAVDLPNTVSSDTTMVVAPTQAPIAVIHSNAVLDGQHDNTDQSLAAENNKRVFNINKLVPLARNVDPNFVRGRFHVEEIACFIKEQWDYVLDKKKKHPGTVTHYSG